MWKQVKEVGLSLPWLSWLTVPNTFISIFGQWLCLFSEDYVHPPASCSITIAFPWLW